MSSSSKIIVLLVLLVVIAGTLLAQFISVPLETFKEARHTTNAGELVAGSLVGQTFVSTHDNLSGLAVMFATYGERRNTAPVEFHLREGIGNERARRVVTVTPG